MQLHVMVPKLTVARNITHVDKQVVQRKLEIVKEIFLLVYHLSHMSDDKCKKTS